MGGGLKAPASPLWALLPLGGWTVTTQSRQRTEHPQTASDEILAWGRRLEGGDALWE